MEDLTSMDKGHTYLYCDIGKGNGLPQDTAVGTDDKRRMIHSSLL
jgi:hypothetical protein